MFTLSVVTWYKYSWISSNVY